MKAVDRIRIPPATAKKLEEFRKSFPGDVSSSYAATVALDEYFEINKAGKWKVNPEWKNDPNTKER